MSAARLAPVSADVAEAVARLQAACGVWPWQDVPRGVVVVSDGAPLACDAVASGADAALSALLWAVLAFGAVSDVVPMLRGTCLCPWRLSALPRPAAAHIDIGITAATSGPGRGGDVEVVAGGSLFISGPSSNLPTGISTQQTEETATGRAGDVTVRAGSLAIVGDGQIDATTRGRGDAGSVTVDVPGAILLDGRGSPSVAGIGSDAIADNAGRAGDVTVRAGSLTVRNAGLISSRALGTGAGGTVRVAVAGDLRIEVGQDSSAPNRGPDTKAR